jgi:hypothetical protein
MPGATSLSAQRLQQIMDITKGNIMENLNNSIANNQINPAAHQKSCEKVRRQSDHAAAAAAIRRHIKGLGIKAKVTSESYSMGSSVRVSVEDLDPFISQQIEEFAGQFQYGHFDGMIDMYEYSNSRKDIPQVKFVFVENRASDAMRQRVWDWVRGYYAGFEDAPVDARQAGIYYNQGHQLWGDNIIYRGFRGSLAGFWTEK